MKTILFALAGLLCLSNAHAQSPYTPAAGTSERKAIMNALRVPCERDLQQKVIFRVQHLRIAGNWALARVVPLRPDGSDIAFTKTKYRELIEEGAFDGEGEALLRKSGGHWELLEWRFGASDTEVPLWFEKYHAPESLND